MPSISMNISSKYVFTNAVHYTIYHIENINFCGKNIYNNTILSWITLLNISFLGIIVRLISDNSRNIYVYIGQLGIFVFAALYNNSRIDSPNRFITIN